MDDPLSEVPDGIPVAAAEQVFVNAAADRARYRAHRAVAEEEVHPLRVPAVEHVRVPELRVVGKVRLAPVAQHQGRGKLTVAERVARLQRGNAPSRHGPSPGGP